jgi:hypothetical protein
MPRNATEWLKERENRQLVMNALRRKEIETDAGIQIITDFDEAAMAMALTCFAAYFCGFADGGVIEAPEATTAYELESCVEGPRLVGHTTLGGR